jgi:hypothetical protein
LDLTFSNDARLWIKKRKVSPLGLREISPRKRWYLPHDGEANEKHVGLGVTEWAQTIVIFLTSSIPQPKVDRLRVDHHVGAVVVEHSRNVFPRECVGGVRNEHAGLTDGTITTERERESLSFMLRTPI